MAELTIDLASYPLAVVQKTAYEFAAVADIVLGPRTESALVLRLTPRGDRVAEDISARFYRRLLDLTVQESISEQTRGIREALVRAALVQANLSPPKR